MQPKPKIAPQANAARTQTGNGLLPETSSAWTFLPWTSLPWTRILAAGTLLASGGLLLSGKRRIGLAAATAGAALALLDQKEVACALWEDLPRQIGNVQDVLGQVQETLDTVVEQRNKLARMLQRESV